MLDMQFNTSDRAEYESMMSEMFDGMSTGVMTGIVEGTKIATAEGWRRVETVEAGQRVLTFDRGLRTVLSVKRVPLWSGSDWCPDRFRPLSVPAGVLGNREPMVLLARQGLLVESDAAEFETGDPFALIQAGDLEGVCGIRRFVPMAHTDVFQLCFDHDEVVFTSSGALCVCPTRSDLIARSFQTAHDHEYRMLSEDTDAALLEDIRNEIEDAWLERNYGDHMNEGVLMSDTPFRAA